MPSTVEHVMEGQWVVNGCGEAGVKEVPRVQMGVFGGHKTGVLGI